MCCQGRKRVGTRREIVESLQLVSSDNKVYLFLPSTVIPSLLSSLCCASPPPSLPTAFQNHSLDSPSLLPPPPFPWTCVPPPYVSGLPEQTSLFSFTIGPRLEGWQTHKGPASLLWAAKETEGGYCWGTESLCITSAQAWRQKNNECMQNKYAGTHLLHIYYNRNLHVSMQTVMIPLYIFPSLMFSRTCRPATETMKEPGKLGQHSYLYGSALFGVCRVP